MEKKEIQEERMRRYFIESGKKIIKGEGISALSVRNVADDAGYSYATMYNYFKDIYSLMNVCIDEFLDEVGEFVGQDSAAAASPSDVIANRAFSFVKYFVQYPGIYELLFLERLSSIGYKPEISTKTENLMLSLIAREFDLLYSSKTAEQVQLLKNMFSAMIHGYLILYMNKRIPIDFIEFKKRFTESVNNFLNASW